MCLAESANKFYRFVMVCHLTVASSHHLHLLLCNEFLFLFVQLDLGAAWTRFSEGLPTCWGHPSRTGVYSD